MSKRVTVTWAGQNGSHTHDVWRYVTTISKGNHALTLFTDNQELEYNWRYVIRVSIEDER